MTISKKLRKGRMRANIFKIEIYYMNPQIKIKSTLNPESFRWGQPRLFDYRYIAHEDGDKISALTKRLNSFAAKYRCKRHRGHMPFEGKPEMWPEININDERLFGEGMLGAKISSNANLFMHWIMAQYQQYYMLNRKIRVVNNFSTDEDGIFTGFESGYKVTARLASTTDKYVYIMMIKRDEEITAEAYAAMHARNPKFWIA